MPLPGSIPRSTRQRGGSAAPANRLGSGRRPDPRASRSSGPPVTPLDRDWRAMRQVLDMLRAGAMRMWGEIGRTT
ncbi:hypothetical protein CPCC7001_1298 [Cyanobium sp. PCC 7001]|uniref:hypothetical protein n=1 Tax=Cyanobium sp. PCC 7001 TaxID=180281 RepID=UPI0001805ACA|nr:hypothetical protein [Cyanobium sp. PCC 7001]EDY38419.1 hypothetical protein CPCC7001_1298 [Cyanobium sp. PCC 7001]